jgi:putative ABC transport system substrate-binding protein
MQLDQIRRREFITLFGGAAATWPLVARAQQGVGMRRIGILSTTNTDDPSVRVFLKALSDLGWAEGRNLQIEVRFAGGDADIRSRFAAELVSIAPEVILVGGSGATEVLLKTTRTVPVVFVRVSDPVEAGFVRSLARPGGNATGFTNFETSLSAKWLELLKEVAPNVARVAVIRDPGVNNGVAQFDAIKAAALSFGIALHPVDVRETKEIERGLADIARSPNGGVVVTGSALGIVHRDLIVGLAAKHRLPGVYSDRTHVASGGMISYAPDRNDQYRRAANYVDRILKGEHPRDLPVQNPVKYELVVNLKTAQALGIEIPATVLGLADEVIE